MTLNELNGYLNEKIPRTLSCDWDNDGIMCCSDGDREIARALFCMDVTAEVIEYAINNNFDVIISHHPLIFKGIKSVSGDFGIPSRIIRLIKSGISVMSFHTRFDAVDGGVNDALADLFELTDVKKVLCDGVELMRVGYLPQKMSLDDFVRLARKRLKCEHIRYAINSESVHKLALVGGSGGDYIREAMLAGADTYLTGEIGYHKLTDCKDSRINLIEAGHYYTENPSLKGLASFILGADPKIHCEFYESNLIKEI